MADTTSTTATTAQADQSSYVQTLLSPALDDNLGAPTDTTAEAQPAATDSGTALEADATTTGGEKSADTTASQLPTVDDLIQNFATETGLDPNDPNQRKTLKRLADKELFIRKLQADNEVLKGTGNGKTADATGPELLTDFEKELVADTTAATAKTDATDTTTTGKTDPKGPQATEAPRYGDLGDEWKTPEDSLTALNKAWESNDLKTVHEIEVARMRRNFDAAIAPSLIAYVNKLLETRFKGFVEKDLGDVVPEVRATAEQKRVTASRDFAIDQLRKAGANDIDKLFDTEDGPPIKFGDQEFPNTPLNRILARHPEIMQVQGTHADPAKRERQAFIARYKLAYQIHKQGAAGVPAETAKALVDAGREIKTAQAADRTRQTINAGPGASGVGEKSQPKSYVGQLNSLPGEVPFSSLIG